MVGRVIKRVRNMWIIIISFILLLGLAIALLFYTNNSEKKIPNRGEFVLVASEKICISMTGLEQGQKAGESEL
ncbi:MAG: hypothetical protein GX283_03265 [Clostridiaceae bacterium]|jgi:flagellar basal body-associated protein FliL|nr:hypothetical protein [Clostridiaceae bacterium]